LGYQVSDLHLKEFDYSLNGGDTTYFTNLSDTLINDTIKLENVNYGQSNQIYSFAIDDAKNKTEQIEDFTPQAIAENKISDFKLYSNPTNSDFTIEYFLQKPEEINFSLYNSQGQELEKKLIKSKTGENKFSVDMLDYSPGIYFSNFTSSDYYFLSF